MSDDAWQIFKCVFSFWYHIHDEHSIVSSTPINVIMVRGTATQKLLRTQSMTNGWQNARTVIGNRPGGYKVLMGIIIVHQVVGLCPEKLLKHPGFCFTWFASLKSVRCIQVPSYKNISLHNSSSLPSVVPSLEPRMWCWMTSTSTSAQRETSPPGLSSSPAILKKTLVPGTMTTVPVSCGNGFEGDYITPKATVRISSYSTQIVTSTWIWTLSALTHRHLHAHIQPTWPEHLICSETGRLRCGPSHLRELQLPHFWQQHR